MDLEQKMSHEIMKVEEEAMKIMTNNQKIIEKLVATSRTCAHVVRAKQIR